MKGVLKLNEIRLGNKILHEGKIYTVDAKMMYAFFTGKTDYDIDNFEAIPLTEEWLLKLGFKKNAEYKYFVKEIRPSKEFILDFSTQSNNWFLCDTDVDTNIKYVHQLQNLYFALTEKELELKVDALQ